MEGIHTLRFTVPASAIDENKHVNNIAYLKWMLDVAIGHTNAVGWPAERYLALGAAWVVRSHHIDYQRPAFLDEPIALHTWIEGMDKRRCPRNYVFLRETDRVVLARARTDWVYVDLKTGRPAEVPPEMAESFPVLTEDQALSALGLPSRRAPMMRE